MPTTPHDDAGGFDAALVADVLDDALRGHPRAGDARAANRIYGIGGLQGSGKSTLARQVAALAAARGITTAIVSVDDVYLDPDARLALARRVHPLFATRGPPGTHDIALACDTLDSLRDGRPVALPRFDKARDRRHPAEAWPRVARVELVIVEGWCLGVPPQPAEDLIAPVNALERDEDRDGRWRRHVNDALANDYPALWRRIDRLLWLQGPGFDVVPAWRWQQELSRRAAEPEAPTQSRAQVERFVQHFERISRHALARLHGMADRVIRLDAQRRPVAEDGVEGGEADCSLRSG